jgi:hypothetical protein
MFIHTVRAFAFAVVASSLVACSAAEVEESEVGEESSEIVSRSARFETFEGLDGQFYFNLLAGNGENVLRSEGYKSQAGRDAGMAAVVAAGVDAKAYEVLLAKNGEYYFNLKAGNGQVIATSETYTRKSSATRAVRTVRSLINLLGATPESKPAPRQERFELFVGEDRQSYFRLRAGNGEIVLGSEGYSSKASAQNGINSVKQHGASVENYRVVETANGQYSIRLVARNNEIIARGEAYASKSNAERAIRTIAGLLADGAPTAE